MVRYTALKNLYEVEKTIGCGGFAKVKLATHLATGEKVAIKIMNKTLLGDDLHRVKLELSALKSFSHEHICQLYQVIETDTHFFIVMEYCSGGELFDHIVEKNRLSESESRMFFRQIVSAVAYLHQLGYAHRDLKPENVLLDKSQNLKLIDFGLCAKPEGGIGNPLFTSCGSPTYAAPELILGKQYLGQEVDVWAMGVLLYALLVGSLPFDDVNIDNLYKKILSGKFYEPPFISRQSLNLIKSMLQVDPRKRIKIKELSSHPWLTLGVLEPVYLHLNNTETYDESCVKIMAEHLEVDQQKMLKELSEWKYDYNTATYFLLVSRKKRGSSLRLNSIGGVQNWTGENKGNKTPNPFSKSSKNTPVSSQHPQTSRPQCASVKIRRKFGHLDSDNLSPGLLKSNISSPKMEKLNKIDDKNCGSPYMGQFLEPKMPSSNRKAMKRPRSSLVDDVSPVPPKKATPGTVTKNTPERKRVHSNSNTPGSAKRMLGSIERSLHRVRHVFTPKKINDNITVQPVLLMSKDLCNVSTTQCEDPELVISELSKGLSKKGISCTRKGFTLKGRLDPTSQQQIGGCSFELEICFLPNLGPKQTSITTRSKSNLKDDQMLLIEKEDDRISQNSNNLVGVRRKRLKGDSWCYKKVCEQILALTATGFNRSEIGHESAV